MIEAVLFDLDLAAAETADLYAVLNSDERLRAGRFRSDTDRNRFIARRGQLRRYLADFADKDPKELQIEPDCNGKPVLRDRPDIRFNLSKSHDLGLCVVSDQGEVGCDIERLDPALAHPEVAARFFATAEMQALQSLSGETWTEGFFRCWTCKEAFVKGIGSGLSHPLQSFSVAVLTEQPPGFMGGGGAWALQAFKPFAGFFAAVATEHSLGDIVLPIPVFREKETKRNPSV